MTHILIPTEKRWESPIFLAVRYFLRKEEQCFFFQIYGLLLVFLFLAPSAPGGKR
jgi:hypothetical protein